jgi:hypothetical protein
MRRFIISAFALIVSATSASATVTYTLRLGDDGTGTPTSGSFAIYAQDTTDNGGIFGAAVDLYNANFTSIQNRLPAGQVQHPTTPTLTRSWGFRAGRTADVAGGKVSGLQDLADPNMVPLYGFGQSGGTFPPGYIVLNSQGSVPYAARPLVGTGTWSGGCPSFELSSVDNKAAVWDNTSGKGVSIDRVEFRQDSLVPLPCSTMATFIGTINRRMFENRAIGNLIYGGKLNDLIGDAAATGSAEVSGGDDGVGNSYFMAKLTGTDAQIAAALDAEPYSIAPSDAKFKELQAAFGGQFAGGEFNALFEIPNIPGPHVLNWDFGNFPGVAVDQLAAVPEPGVFSLLGLGCLMLNRRRR